jgi:hypothetical protein
MRRPIIEPAQAAFGPDHLRDLKLHQLRRDRFDRLVDHIGVLIEQYP